MGSGTLRKVIEHSNLTRAAYPDQTVDALFEEIAEREPNKIAIVQGNKKISFHDLNKQADQLASSFIQKGICHEDIIAIAMDRSIEAITAMIGTLKSGAAYVPIDIALPKDRIQFILEDCGAKLIVIDDDRVCSKLHTCPVFKYSELIQNNGDETIVFTPKKHTINSLAYVIYTSGTTGKPKGVMLEHKGLVNLQLFARECLNIQSKDRVLQFNNLSFDASVGEIYQALLSGASLFLIPREDIDNFNKFARYINIHNISVISMTPSYLEYVDPDTIHVKHLKVITGGTKVSKEFVKKWGEKFQYINEYGPSETTINATYWKYDKEEENELLDHIPIGKPLPNMKIYIMDDGEIVTNNKPGEICVSGIGVARGYINNQELTDEKFVCNVNTNFEKTYKTGDKGRWTVDGTIEFLGRLDNQVKVRGYRIELDEIEFHISNIEGINRTKVVLIEDNNENKNIAAYFIADKTINDAELRNELSGILPDYMIPNHFIQLDSMPLTTNGKIDQEKLPNPYRDSHSIDDMDHNSIERKMLSLWREVLGRINITTKASFASLGGDSLKAIALVSKIAMEFGKNISIKEIFRLGTIEKLIEHLTTLEESETGITIYYPQITHCKEELYKPFPLTGIQLAYLVGREDSFEIGGISTNGYFEFQAAIDIDRFQHALNKMISRHDSLRTIINEDGTQEVLKSKEYQIPCFDMGKEREEIVHNYIIATRKRKSNQIVNPGKWPLFEIDAIRLPDQSFYFFVIIDPIICDDSSFKIVIKEMKELYVDVNAKLPEIPISFRDYVIALESLKKTEIYRKDQMFWEEKLEDFPEAPQLPMKTEPSSLSRPEFGKHQFFLNPDEWKQLKTVSGKHGITVSTLLCAAYALIIQNWSSQKRFGLNLTVFNRLPFHPDMSKVVGDFTTLLLLDINFESNDFWEKCRKVQDELLNALEHRHYDGLQVIRALMRKKGMEGKAVMPIVFTSGLSEQEGDSFNDLIDFKSLKYFSTRTSQVYLDNQVYEINDGLYITWDYVEQLFDEITISAMFKQYIAVIRDIANHVDTIHLEISDEEKEYFKKYDNTYEKIPYTTLDNSFSRTVSRYPELTAIKHHNTYISYQKLDDKSNQIARYLVQQGIEKEDKIGILGFREIGTIINMLGILKAGGTYIPIDPDYPEERKKYIIEKSNCKLVLHPELQCDRHVTILSKEEFKSRSTLEQTAYVIFTSGSTGQPKGVKITHKAAFNTIYDINHKYQVNDKDRIIGISSLCFDLSVYDIFGSLSAGATLILIDDQRDILSIRDVIIEEEITVWNSVPAIMDILLDGWNDKADSTQYETKLRTVILSGDWIPTYLPKKINNKFANAEVISMGGATEASIWSIYYPIHEINNEWKSIPYGYPLANQQIYILNEELERCPINVIGEIYIGGVGAAQGYINDDKRTKDAFLSHATFGYIYKTGDFGAFRSAGYVEFLGRKDSQIKIRGYRVELGEIEKRLESFASIDQVIVIDWKDENDEKKLIAFYTSKKALDFNTLNAFASEGLPNYMVPAQYIHMDHIPLTHNGKIDRKKLESMVKPFEVQTSKRQIIDAENSVQKCLVKIWEEVFGQEISIEDNYYELGGDSLKAITIVAKIDQALSIRVPIRELLRKNTIRFLGEFIKTQENAGTKDQMKPALRKEYYAVTPSQERMFALNSFDANGIAYHIPLVLKMTGIIDSDRLKLALEKVTKKHSILRTSFHVINNKLVQKIHETADIDFDIKIISSSKHSGTRETVSHLCKEFVHPFHYELAPLFRVQLVYVQHSENYLLLDFDHLIADGVSQGIFIKDLWDAYEGKDQLENHQFVDYSEHMQTNTDYELLSSQRNYWMERLSEKNDPLNLLTDKKRKNRNTYVGGNLYFDIDNRDTDRIFEFISHKNLTLYTFMIGVYFIMLYKYTRQYDITVGSAAVGRNHKETEGIIGSFINTIVIKNTLEDKFSAIEFLGKVKDSVIGAFENSDYPFADIVKDLEIKHESGRNPLFDTMFVLEDIRDFEQSRCDMNYEPIIFDLGIAKFDITFTILRSKTGLRGNIEYSKEIFNHDTIERMRDHYIRVLDQIMDHPDHMLESISILTDSEVETMKNFQGDRYIIDKNDSILKRIFWNVTMCPNNLAVYSNGSSTTYKQIWEDSISIRNRLIGDGIAKNDVVAFLTNQTNRMISAILGTWAAGACYLPIDIHYPDERIEYILKDSGTKTILSEDKLADHYAANFNVIYIDQPLEHADFDQPMEYPDLDMRSYIIYTSGTTGRPKGVIIQHGALLNLCLWHIDYYKINSSDITSKYAGLGFDASVWEMFPYLTAGASIHIIPDEIKLDLQALNDYYEKHRITTGFLPTEMFEQFIKLDNHSLRLLLTGAGKLKHVQPKNYEIFNNYGPTEYTVVTTAYKVNDRSDNIPIGKPIHNTTIYIVDENLQCMPIGIPGELCVAGSGIAEGYLNNKELNAEKFVENPFESHGKLYKTGDLARWKSDGNIEYLGRIDHQIKIRGFRVEPGEIEYQILQMDGIKAAAVILQKEELIAFIVKEDDVANRDIAMFLKRYLPEYMIPGNYMELSEIPLTANGKVNYEYLNTIRPAPVSNAIEDEVATGTTALYLMNLWKDVLKLDSVGIHQNFYQAGGDSLKAAILLYRLNTELNLHLAISDILEKDTISELSRLIDMQKGIEEDCNDTAQSVQEDYPLSFAQERVYSAIAGDDHSTSYNVPVGVMISEEINPSIAKRALYAIVDRHEILRTGFIEKEGEVRQKIAQNQYPDIAFCDYRQMDPSEEFIHNLMDQFISYIDVTKAPLMKVLICHMKDKKTFMLINIHHLIFDGNSVSILIDEFLKSYHGEKLLPLPFSYYKYAERLRERDFSKARDYWLKEYERKQSRLNVVTDYQRPSVKNFDGGRFEFRVENDVYLKMRSMAADRKISMYQFTLGIFGILLHKISNQDDIIIGTVHAGREYDTANLIGMFVNTVAIMLETNHKQDLTEFFGQVKKKYIEGTKYGDYPFQNLLNDLNIKRDLSRNPLFDIMFVYNQLEESKYQLIPYSSRNSKFDLTFTIVSAPDCLHCSFEYSIQLFKDATIERYSRYFLNIVDCILENNRQTIGEVQVLTTQHNQLLQSFAYGKNIDVPDKSIATMFAEIVSKYPNTKAVVCGRNDLTYVQLDQYSNGLANYLIQVGVAVNDLVGIMLDESVDMIVSMIGIMKAGAGYLPILPSFPSERINHIIQDSNIKVIITKKEFGRHTIIIEHRVDLDGDLTAWNHSKPVSTHDAESRIAYAIYTSGTTGLPKGVQISQKNLLNLVYSLNEIIYKEYSSPVKVSLLASYIFDGSVKQIFPALLLGNTLVIAESEDKIDGDHILNFYLRENIVISDCTPSHLKMILLGDDKDISPVSLKTLCVGGEPLPVNVANDIRERLSPVVIELINLYGPTETTVDASYFKVKEPQTGTTVPIGRPIPNAEVYIFDKSSKLCPIGVPGEICIGGKGVGLGYINLPDLNQMKFVKNPLKINSYIYKTGDLGKWTQDGCIDFLGRADRQTKIRGYRVELEEIEHILSNYDEVEQAVVLAKDDEISGKILCAYIVSVSPIHEREVKAYLLKKIPQYMVPSQFYEIAKIPLTENGKVNESELLALKYNREKSQAVEEGNPLEKLIIKIWSGVLKVENITLSDNFFSLGGDSLKAIQVAANMNKEGLSVTIKDILQSASIVELSKKTVAVKNLFCEEKVHGICELTPIQKQFFKKRYAPGCHFNQSILLSQKEEIHSEIVIRVLKKLNGLHDILRTRFYEKDQDIIQEILPEEEECFNFKEYDFSDQPDSLLEESIKNVISMEQKNVKIIDSKLVSMCKIRSKNGDLLLWMISHLVVDSVSWGILVDDFIECYNADLHNREYRIPYKASSYKTWASSLYSYCNSVRLEQQMGYWTKMLANKYGKIKKNGILKERNFASMGRTRIQLDASHNHKLMECTRNADRLNVQDLLISALALSIQELFEDRSDYMLINLESHGREAMEECLNLNRTVGWFTSSFPVVIPILDRDRKRQVIEVKEILKSIPDHGIGYGVFTYLTNKPKTAESLNCEPEISVNYLGSNRTETEGDFSIVYGTSDEQSANIRESCLVNINAFIHDQILSIDILYDKSEIGKSIIQFENRFMDKLNELIDFCSTSAIMIPSDFKSAKGISQEDLDKIQKLYEKK